VNTKDWRIKAHEGPFLLDFIDNYLMKHWVKLQILFSPIIKIVRKYWILALDYTLDIMDPWHSFNSILAHVIKWFIRIDKLFLPFKNVEKFMGYMISKTK
tara:strand:- start:201 stop:500 length:300 start_codon:yes stop_codon:yes gene_type:complete